MRRVQDGALARYTFEALDAAPVVHGVFTRLGGVSEGPFASLNVGHTVGDDPAAVAANHERILNALGLPATALVMARQVHGNRVAVTSASDGGRAFPETDALISNVPGLALLLRFADCVPVLFYAPKQGAVGLAHAGWQGTLKGVAAETAQAMMATYGCRAEELRVGIGPAIGPCCFEVGPEVLEAVRARFAAPETLISRQQANGKAHLDLWLANVRQLQALGVREIEVAGLCTACHLDEFYSHRAEQGRTGRFPAIIGLRAD